MEKPKTELNSHWNNLEEKKLLVRDFRKEESLTKKP